jgi:hypothetical protein
MNTKASSSVCAGPLDRRRRWTRSHGVFRMYRRAIELVALLILGAAVSDCVQEEATSEPDDAGAELNDAAERDTEPTDGSSEESIDVAEMDTYNGEPIYEQLPFDDPNLVCCLIRELTSQCGSLAVGGRRRCSEPPLNRDGGYPDATLDPRGWQDTVIDGCPVYVPISRFATCRGSLEGSGGSGW